MPNTPEYRPHPIDTSAVKLDPELEELVERLAENVHDIWAEARLANGWRYGEHRDDARKTHPCLVSYGDLPDAERGYDRRSVIGTLKAILALGYRIAPPEGGALGQPSGEATRSERSTGTARSTTDRIPRRESLDALMATLASSDVRGLRAEWRSRDEALWAGSPEPFLWLARRLRRDDPLLAYEVLAEASARWPEHREVRHLLGLVMADSGATKRASEIADALCDELRRLHDSTGAANDGSAPDSRLVADAFGLRGRTHKDLALASDDPADARDQLDRAYRAYREGFERTPPGNRSYPAINAAAVAALLGRRGEARDLADIASREAERELAADGRGPQGGYWQLATLGEAALIRGELAKAGDWYGKAMAAAGRNYGDIASTRRQARLIAQQAGVDARWVDRNLPVPRVVVFAGHVVDFGGRATRFPESSESDVGAAILDSLTELGAGFGFSGAACGSDILFLEAMSKLGGQSVIVLPYNQQDFVTTSVAIAGDRWRDRFDSVVGSASDLVEASGAPFAGGGVMFEYSNMLLLGLAAIQSRMLDTELVGVAVWDGRAGNPGSTADAVRSWKTRGIRVEIIAPVRPTERQPSRMERGTDVLHA